VLLDPFKIALLNVLIQNTPADQLLKHRSCRPGFIVEHSETPFCIDAAPRGDQDAFKQLLSLREQPFAMTHTLRIAHGGCYALEKR
jgi:hypothetical protein